ncbi:MAG: alpha/beta hydrolase [Alphaproteobacteria bacterium]|nr:alpha/beta hydrolase [Alphaproteobacteria bacterium]
MNASFPETPDVMANNVQIPAGIDTYIQATHSRPSEDSSAEWDSLLVVMVHDFPGDRNAKHNTFHDLEFLLRAKGYHSLRFDFRGCGDSGGAEEEFTLELAGEDYQSVMGWAHENGYRRFVLVGEGLGASIALLNMSNAVSCAVMLWPKIDLPLIAQTAFKVESAGPQAEMAGHIALDGHRIGYDLINELCTIDIKEPLEKTQCAVLAMHGVMDDISPIDQLDLLREHAYNLQRLEITSFQDGVHALPQLNHRKAMYFHITQFIEKYS